MELRGDPVCVRIGVSLDLSVPRFALSDGLRSVVGVEAEAGNFEAGAIVAAQPWRDVSFEELRAVLAIEAEWDPPRTVCVLNFAPRLTDIPRDAPAEASAAACLDIIEEACALADPVVCHGWARSPPGLINTTINPATGKRLGLHVDDWDDLPVGQRHRSRNRISLNFGPGDRELLFWSRSHSQIIRSIAPAAEEPYWSVCRKALLANMTVPVVKCRLRPGEAYIAPTETLVHDASTAGSPTESWHVTFRSDIVPRPGCLR